MSTAVISRSDNGIFIYDNAAALSSSGDKRIWLGTYQRVRDDREIPAVVNAFPLEEQGRYASEIASLSRNMAIGVGPSLLSLVCNDSGSCPRDLERPLKFIVEHAGVSLEKAVRYGAEIPWAADKAKPLHAVGTEQRHLESAKILFDVAVQLDNMHRIGLYHRDLRLANICVRRYGPYPADIRATIIDFEKSATLVDEVICYANNPYRRLFDELPRLVNPKMSSPCKTASALDLDTGYFAALALEIISGQPVERASAEELAAITGEIPLFGYKENGEVFSRRFDQELDIDRLACEAGLDRLDTSAFLNPAQLGYVQAAIKHGGYYDAYDIIKLEREHHVVSKLECEDELARLTYGSYVAQRVTRGIEDDPPFENRSEDLVESDYEQVRDIPNKIRSIGYKIVPLEECSESQRISCFSDEEIEYLALLEHRRWISERRERGWIWGEEKSVDGRISPYLVPYADLSDDVKEYDREPVRNIITLLGKAGFAVSR